MDIWSWWYHVISTLPMVSNQPTQALALFGTSPHFRLAAGFLQCRTWVDDVRPARAWINCTRLVKATRNLWSPGLKWCNLEEAEIDASGAIKQSLGRWKWMSRRTAGCWCCLHPKCSVLSISQDWVENRVHQNGMIDHHVIMITLRIVVYRRTFPFLEKLHPEAKQENVSNWQLVGLINGLT